MKTFELLTITTALTAPDFYQHAEETARIIDGLPVAGFCAIVNGSARPINYGADVFDIIECLDCKNGADVYRTAGGYLITVHGGNVSTDGGRTWEPRKTNIELLPAGDVFHDTESGEIITRSALAYEFGFLRSAGETDAETVAEYIRNCTDKNGTLETVADYFRRGE